VIGFSAKEKFGVDELWRALLLDRPGEASTT